MNKEKTGNSPKKNPFGTYWSRWYLLVIGVLIIELIVFNYFTQYFS